MEDHEIIDLFFERREEALQETVKKYGKRLFLSAMNVLNNKEDAEECVNDALMNAWEAIPPNRPAMFGAFLAKIARNLSINKWKAQNTARRGGGEMEILLDELEYCLPASKLAVPEQAYESQLLTDAINDCLRLMDKTTRVAFVLRYFHGENIQSICTKLNMRQSKAKSLLFRARKKLKAHLEKEGIAL